MAKEDAIGMGPDGKIEQYKKGEPIPAKPFRVIDAEGNVQEMSLDDDADSGADDPFLDLDDSDLDLEEDEEEDDAV